PTLLPTILAEADNGDRKNDDEWNDDEWKGDGIDDPSIVEPSELDPTLSPTLLPSLFPTISAEADIIDPTLSPTEIPTLAPTLYPSLSPTIEPAGDVDIGLDPTMPTTADLADVEENDSEWRGNDWQGDAWADDAWADDAWGGDEHKDPETTECRAAYGTCSIPRDQTQTVSNHVVDVNGQISMAEADGQVGFTFAAGVVRHHPCLEVIYAGMLI
ncbi:hypothetical protein THAOC_15529, partial [Thalassiosira oceanica]